MSFADLKKKSRLGSLTEKLVKEVGKGTGGTGSKTVDERFWKPEMGKGGTGSAVIRFLPAIEGEDVPWVKLFNHAFQDVGGWYIENSLTSIGQKDPVSDLNRSLVNEHGGDFKRCPQKVQDTVRDRKRKLSYYSNIYVVKDPLHPENEGKVFLFKYGKKIFDKILTAMQPEFEDEEAINPFDFWEGANFKLKIVKKDGYWNYDNSEFASPAPILDDDEVIEALWNKEHSLAAIVNVDQFKSYEDLEKRMNMVLGLGKVAPKTASHDEEEQYESYVPKRTKEDNVLEELEASYQKSKNTSELPDTMKKELDNLSSDNDDDDAIMAKFQGLVDD
jgi:hypothetical protein